MIINFNKKFFNRKYIAKISQAYNYAIDLLKIKCSDLEVSLSFVSHRQIAHLNHKFRNKNMVTDVLSFPNLIADDTLIGASANKALTRKSSPKSVQIAEEDSAKSVKKNASQIIIDKISKDNFPLEINQETGALVLGDICICKKVAFVNAKKYGNSQMREIVYLAVHGFLHLLGYDHMIDADKKSMRKAEEDIMSHIRLRREK